MYSTFGSDHLALFKLSTAWHAQKGVLPPDVCILPEIS